MSNTRPFLSSRKARVIGLLRPLKDVTVTAGETATFDCELSYEDIPVEWYLKGKKLEPNEKVKEALGVFCVPSPPGCFHCPSLCSKVPFAAFAFFLPLT